LGGCFDENVFLASMIKIKQNRKTIPFPLSYLMIGIVVGFANFASAQYDTSVFKWPEGKKQPSV
jgi:hypothetical protein